jgi:hypothetical protein
MKRSGSAMYPAFECSRYGRCRDRMAAFGRFPGLMRRL